YMAAPRKEETPIRLQGQLLIADPSLRDGIFNRSVVLLAEHSAEEGAFGLILNHPSGHKVGEFLKEEEFSSLSRIPVHIGGPVAREHLTFAALWWTEEKGLRFATRISAADAVKHAQNSGTLVRAFVGYSGWSEGQLESELRQQSWITARPTADLLACHHDNSLWCETLRAISPFHKIIAEAPPDPFLN
ncbi:MAG: YqgE/AlgH family protein, partial [Akkermansiaceae bacterium]|nr:YqgE/AlgH family protein [Akkermansiaceae bacterium]